jgi:hypothetical protein
VPPWLLGCWRRSWIKRGGATEPGETDVVRYYVQCPDLFADVSTTGGFAGLTRVVDEPEVISWHAALDAGERPVFVAQWAAIEAGAPLPTVDQGRVEILARAGAGRVSAWLEHSLETGEYTELWERVAGDDGRYCAARRGCAILAVAGDRFCYVLDERQQRQSGACCCAAGSVSSGWEVEVCSSPDAAAAGQQQVGTPLQVAGLEGWVNWPGVAAAAGGAGGGAEAAAVVEFPDGFGAALPVVAPAGSGCAPDAAAAAPDTLGATEAAAKTGEKAAVAKGAEAVAAPEAAAAAAEVAAEEKKEEGWVRLDEAPRVRLHGLGAAGLNGCEGVRGRWHAGKERFEVQ